MRASRAVLAVILTVGGAACDADQEPCVVPCAPAVARPPRLRPATVSPVPAAAEPATDVVGPTFTADGSRAELPAPEAPDLAVRSILRYPTRIAIGPDGRVAVTDAETSSVFLLDAELRPAAEIAGVAGPLGVTFAADGRLYVGSAGQRRVEVFAPDGARLAVVGEGRIRMPNDLALDAEGFLYVADSRARVVRIFDPSGEWAGDLGEPDGGPPLFPFPVALAVHGGELYVAEQVQGRVQVFDLRTRQPVRAFGERATVESEEWRGRFGRLQSLAIDADGRLHALDAYQSRVQILDRTTGDFLEAYGGPDVLRLPLHLALTEGGDALVTNAGHRRVERLRPPP